MKEKSKLNLSELNKKFKIILVRITKKDFLKWLMEDKKRSKLK